jgi:hypothetical protein
MMPSGLKPGHILLYEGTDALGDTIDFFESGKFCHAALVYDATRLVRQNPGGPAFEDLSAQPWNLIVVKRLNLDSLVGTSGSPVELVVGYDPHSDPLWISQFEASYARHSNDLYDYPGIAASANEGILSDVGLGLLAQLLKKSVDPVTALDTHMDFCSAFDGIICTEATQARFNWPLFNFNPKENIRSMTPQDLSQDSLLENI